MNRVIRKAGGLLMAGCLALLGMSASAQTYLDEDFSGASGITPPAGWVNATLPGGGIDSVWSFDDPATRNISGAGFTAPYGILDSDFYGFGATQIAALSTPIVDLSAATEVYLSFSELYRSIGGSAGTLEYSTD
ncbi:MAG: hypothetical protein HRU12_08555, partial [Phaeodactylibacter sp.]|nr:hypothetical protein [Phaeodactylibacter sp.]